MGQNVLKKNVSIAGGLLTGGSTDVFIEGAGAVRLGDADASHGAGPHAAATMAAGSATVFVNGLKLCREGDAATCGHTGSGGATTVQAG